MRGEPEDTETRKGDMEGSVGGVARGKREVRRREKGGGGRE